MSKSPRYNHVKSSGYGENLKPKKRRNQKSQTNLLNISQYSNTTKFSFNSKPSKTRKARLPPKCTPKNFIQMNIDKIERSKVKPISAMSITSIQSVRSEKSRKSGKSSKKIRRLNVYDSKVDKHSKSHTLSRLAMKRGSNQVITRGGSSTKNNTN